MSKLQEGHIGALQTLDHRIAHLSPEKQKLAKQHHSLANAAALRANVKEAEKHFTKFKEIVGEETITEEGWVQGPPKPGHKVPVKLNNGDMGKITHDLGSHIIVTTRDGWKRHKRSDIAAHHISEEAQTIVEFKEKKTLKQVRGRTATGQKANVIDVDPKLRLNTLRNNKRF